MHPVLHSDLDLARRLEGTEVAGNTEFVEARARVDPEAAAEWTEVAGARALFDGPESPCTQVFGLGVFDPVEETHLERIEAFYRERGSATFLEVCSLAPPSLHGMLADRGYRPIELSHVMVRPLDKAIPESDAAGDAGITIRPAEPDEAAAWAYLSAEGWSDEAPQYLDFIRDLGRVNAARRDTICFYAEASGQPIATGALCIGEGVALLAGASTIPRARRRGAQTALLAARLHVARDRGCDLAMVVTEPGSRSQRNAERNGFQVAYGRTKWHRPLSGDESHVP